MSRANYRTRIINNLLTVDGELEGVLKRVRQSECDDSSDWMSSMDDYAVGLRCAMEGLLGTIEAFDDENEYDDSGNRRI